MSRLNNYSTTFPPIKDHEGKRLPLCRRCRTPLPKGRSSFCSKTCSDAAMILVNPHIRSIVIPLLSRYCQLGECEKDLSPYGWRGSQAEIHHIIPVSEGGLNVIENLAALCHECHVAVHVARRFYQKIYDELPGLFGEEILFQF